jgi:hypothetical protein
VHDGSFSMLSHATYLGRATVETDSVQASALHTTAWLQLGANFDGGKSVLMLYCDASLGCTSGPPSGYVAGLRISESQVPGYIAYAADGTENTGTSGSPLVPGTWYRVELKTRASTTQGVIEIWINGSRVSSSSNRDTRNALGYPNIGFFTQDSMTAINATVYFDDVFMRAWVDPEPAVSLGPIEP